MTPVKEHGNWVSYVPETPPGAAPPGSGFCMRVEDGKDWYEYQKQSPFINSASAKCTIRDNILITVTRDESALFPEDALLGEFETTEEDVQKAYGGWTYDPVTKTISWIPPPTPGGGETDPMDVAILANNRITAGVTGAVEMYNSMPAPPELRGPPTPANNEMLIKRLEETLKEMCREMMKLKGTPSPLEFKD